MWYLPALVPLALVVLCLIHIFRTGRDRFWIYIIIFLPVAGCIAYFFIEVLPDLIHGKGAARLSAGVARVVSPGRRLREREAALDLAPTVENRIALAEAWMEEEDPAKAADLYAAFLRNAGRTDEAAREVTSLERGFALMPGFSKRTQRRWVQAARKELG